MDDDIRHQIGLLEERIEALNESIARCAKISVGSKIAIALGALWFVLLLLRIVYFDATPFVAAVAALLGGVVMLGSNSTTWAQTEAALHDAEAARAELIGRIELRVVSDNTRTLH